MSDNEHHERSLSNYIQREVNAKYLPILITVLVSLLGWLGAQKLNSIDRQVSRIPEYTQQLAVLEARFAEREEARQDAVRIDRAKLDRVQEHVVSVDSRVQDLESEHKDIERRLERLER